MTQRMLRENNTFNNRIVRLDQVKEMMLRDTYNVGIELTYYYFMNSLPGFNKYEKQTHYLHYLIMFSTPQNLNHFLNEQYHKYGEYATKIFVNYPLVSFADHNIITPIMCAMLWSNNPDILRILYYWGGDLSQIDVHGKYPEEKYGSFYVNHMNHLIAPNLFIMGLRCARDFNFIVRELQYLAGEKEPPPEWHNPGSAFGNSRTHSTNSISQDSSTHETNQNT